MQTAPLSLYSQARRHAFPFSRISQLVIIQADIIEGSVFHPKSPRKSSEMHKSESFIQMAGVNIALHNGIELQNTESEPLSLLKAIQDQLFAYMLSAAGAVDRIARI